MAANSQAIICHVVPLHNGSNGTLKSKVVHVLMWLHMHVAS